MKIEVGLKLSPVGPHRPAETSVISTVTVLVEWSIETDLSLPKNITDAISYNVSKNGKN